MNPTQRRFDWIVGSLVVEAICLDSEYLDEVQQMLSANGYQLLISDLAGVSSAWDCFRSIVGTLPTDPEYLGLHNDINEAALEDSLWGGLSGPEDLALVLVNAETLMNEYLNLFLLIYTGCELHRKLQNGQV